MSFKPKYALLVVCCALLPSFLISACSGPAFESSRQDGGSGGGPSGGGSANVGSGASTGEPCAGPEDCNDNDACTRDRCTADGVCDASPMCAGNQRCCSGGDCAECCDHADCDDGVVCTNNICFSGQCMFVPDDSKCEATQYCSTNDGCRAKQICGLVEGEPVAKVCDDGSPCTTDSCSGTFCKHDFCADGSVEGGLCCPDKGCAKCCTDSQCNKDQNPCTIGACSADGTCDEVALCGAGQHCCPSADRKTATCGSCCSAEDCDDGVACTFDQCGGGECSRTPDPSRCDVANGYFCDPRAGCQKAPTCQQASDCEGKATSPCQINPSCVQGQCKFEGCGYGTKCCLTGCAACCDDTECDDGIACTKDVCDANGCSSTPDDSLCMAQVCDPEHGGCIECHDAGDCDDASACTTDSCNMQTHTCVHANACDDSQVCNAGKCAQCASDSDCQGGVITMAEPKAAVGTCSVSECLSGVCKTTPTTCTGLQQCCAPYGCAIRCSAAE